MDISNDWSVTGYLKMYCYSEQSAWSIYGHKPELAGPV